MSGGSDVALPNPTPNRTTPSTSKGMLCSRAAKRASEPRSSIAYPAHAADQRSVAGDMTTLSKVRPTIAIMATSAIAKPASRSPRGGANREKRCATTHKIHLSKETERHAGGQGQKAPVAPQHASWQGRGKRGRHRPRCRFSLVTVGSEPHLLWALCEEVISKNPCNQHNGTPDDERRARKTQCVNCDNPKRRKNTPILPPL